MDEEWSPNEMDEEELRTWFKTHGPGALASVVRFDRDQFFSRTPPSPPRRHWLEWGSAAALILALLGGAHFLTLSDHSAASTAGSTAQYGPLRQKQSSERHAVAAPAPAAATNAPAFAPATHTVTTSIYRNGRFRFSVAVPIFFTNVYPLSAGRGESGQSSRPLAAFEVYGEANRKNMTVASWIRQLGPESLLQQGPNWVLASRTQVVNGVKTVTEDKIFVGHHASDILQIQYPLRDQTEDRGWVKAVVQSFTPGRL